MKYLLLVLLFVVSCGSIPNDLPTTSWASNNYYSMHFQFEQRNYFGILPINLAENEPLPRDSVTIKMFHTGTMHIFSRACEINSSVRFNGDYLFPITQKRNCDIKFTLMPDPVKGMQHEYIEIGKIITHVVLANERTISINNNETQHVMQVVEGMPSIYQSVTIQTHSKSGILLANSSEGRTLELEYNSDNINLLLQQLWCNKSCTWYLRAIPSDQDYTRIGRLEISVYGSATLPLEQLPVTTRGNKLELSYPEYIAGANINGKNFFRNVAWAEYKKDKEYLITYVTKKGRKAVIIYKNGVVTWSSLQ